tara:strand:+ start:4601 stop:5206 length:606 start_codon:yes stop_codon:yes gene_type:complete
MNKNEFMTNGEGHLVPVSKVKPEHKLENDLVLEIIEDALQRENEIKTFKETAFENLNSLVDILGEKYGVSKGGRRGNMSFTSYDGLKRINISVQDYIEFGAELQIAKQLIDQCIHEWSSEANENLKAMVNQAFRVDKNNKLNTQAILGLRRLNIQDSAWLRAMEAITNSIKVSKTKSYIRFYQRKSPDHKFEAITLDIAKV